MKKRNFLYSFRIFKNLRRYFFTGLLVLSPMVVSIWLFIWFVEFIDAQVLPLVPPLYNPMMLLPQPYHDYTLPGFGLLVVFVLCTFMGWVATNFVGKHIINFFERIFDRIPAVRSLYGLMKQIMQTVMADKSSAFRRVVLIEYPRENCWVMAFVTGENHQDFSKAPGLEKGVSVFVPTTPNPTSGFLLFLPQEDVIDLDISVEFALKILISGGMVKNS